MYYLDALFDQFYTILGHRISHKQIDKTMLYVIHNTSKYNCMLPTRPDIIC